MMRLGVLAMLAFGLYSLGLAQQLPQAPKLQMPQRLPDNSRLKCSCEPVLSIESFLAASRAHTLLLGGKGEPAKSSAEAGVDIKSWLQKTAKDEERGPGGENCFGEISKYGQPLLSLVDRLHYLGHGSTGLLSMSTLMSP